MAGKDKFNDSYITNTGRHMIISIGGGVGKITYTKAIAYGQDISGIDEQDIYALSSLTDERLETQVTVSDIEDSSITVTADFNNKTLEDDVSFNSIGWFAKLDTDDTKHNLKANQEYLLAITPANGLQTLAAAPPDHRSSQSICVNLTMGISNAANVDMTVNEAGVIHQGELDIQLTKVKKSFDEKLSTKANTNDVYTKQQIEDKLSNLGSVKSVNGAKPDNAGNVNIDVSGQVKNISYTKDEIINLLNSKASADNTYTKQDVINLLSAKANANDVYTKQQVDDKFEPVNNKQTDHENRIKILEENQFDVQTFTDENAASNWEAQRPGKRMAVVNK